MFWGAGGAFWVLPVFLVGVGGVDNERMVGGGWFWLWC